jgi:hypothetical protein
MAEFDNEAQVWVQLQAVSLFFLDYCHDRKTIFTQVI